MTPPVADHDGFTDSTGKHMSYEDGLRNAARCILDQGETDVVVDLLRLGATPDEVLIWIVYPDTGVFAS